MGMTAQGSRGGGSRRGRRGGRKQLLSEINVTPFVDVMLVLLIIFMVAAPLLTVGVPVNSSGQVYLQETEIAIGEVVAKLEAIATTGYNERIYVRGDTNADYGTVMKVMARISAAGFKNLGLVTLQEQDG